MPPNNNNQPFASMPFWDFIQAIDPNQASGHGVDHRPNANANPFGQFFSGFAGPAGFGPRGPAGPWDEADWDFGFPPHGRRRGGGRFRGGGRGRRGGMSSGEEDDTERRRHRRHDAGEEHEHEHEHENQQEHEHSDDTDAEHIELSEVEKDASPDTLRGEVPDPDEVVPEDEDHPMNGSGPEQHNKRQGRRGFRRGPGGPGARGGMGGGCRRGGRFGPQHGPRGPGFGPRHGGPGGHFHGPPPPYAGRGGPFDLSALLQNIGNAPFWSNLQENVENFRGAQNNPNSNTQNTNDDAFLPPVDIFNTARAYVLHLAIPGAKKEDVGVNWDADKSTLSVAGVVHRPGDEAFLATLVAEGERKVGMFERNIPLPPAGANERDDIDGLGITAKMEDGVLIVTVPKVEKEWTEIRKVDIE